MDKLDEAIKFYTENKDTQDKTIKVVSQTALIKTFEFTFELSWNLMKDYLEYDGVSDISGSRDAIRKAFASGLIENGDEREWLNIVNDRNLSSHTYNENVALELSQKIVERYYELFKRLKTVMESR
jgi:nucleotidyltransferase substrate binding protein (TIGR01987 family)